MSPQQANPYVEVSVVIGQKDRCLGAFFPCLFLFAPLYFSEIKCSCKMDLNCVLFYSLCYGAVFCSVVLGVLSSTWKEGKEQNLPRQDPLPWMPCTTSLSFGFSDDSAEPGKASTGNPLWFWFLLWTCKESILRMALRSCAQLFPAKMPRILEPRLSSLSLGTVSAWS